MLQGELQQEPLALPQAVRQPLEEQVLLQEALPRRVVVRRVVEPQQG